MVNQCSGDVFFVTPRDFEFLGNADQAKLATKKTPTFLEEVSKDDLEEEIFGKKGEIEKSK